MACQTTTLPRDKSEKATTGNFFEDFTIGMVIGHATPRTLTNADQALYTALYGSRFALQSSAEFARHMGHTQAPLDDLLVFHVIFGKSVPDISLNALANLGYANCRFIKPVYSGDTLTAQSTVIGLKPNSNGKTGVVYVETTGKNQRDETVLSFNRWVMVKKRDEAASTKEHSPAPMPKVVSTNELGLAIPHFGPVHWNSTLSGSEYLLGDYHVGERINHIDGATVQEAEHQMATRLYQNTARVHFDAHYTANSRFGRPLIYGGHVISIARAQSFNGLANACNITAINGGRHIAPLFAGDTVYSWSEIIDSTRLKNRDEIGALRIRTIATKNRSCEDFPYKDQEGKYDEGVILELDYWATIPT
ncbi:MaoC family dehydratase [Polycladidibacter stylochi]|uniref:MaoC family dehydratase n=1 Tax=Polycladidibacter stylochi TaxID=1807766 RepID=UPI000832AECC|nr:MaoC family dehydratase [Pseudovibrio stylochi]